MDKKKPTLTTNYSFLWSYEQTTD